MNNRIVKRSLSVILIICTLCGLCIISEAYGSRGYCDYYGFSYESYISYLKSHENDSYYLGTPYHNKDWRSPNGDTSFNGSAGMNCNGFVWHVLQAVIKKNGGNPRNYDIQNYSNYKGWIRILDDNNIKYYIFNNKWEALNSGVMAQGDIIYMFESSSLTPSSNNHTGIYWGNGKTDVFWHSAGRCNQISNIWSGGSVVKFVVAKMCVSGKIGIYSNDSYGKKLNGNKYTVYNSSGKVYKTVDGNTYLQNVPFGTYTIKQTQTANGYEKDNSVKKVTVSIKGTNQKVTFVNKLKQGAVSVKALRGQYFPSVNQIKYYPLSDYSFDVYSDSACTKYVDTVTTGSNGVAVYGYKNSSYSLTVGSTYYFKPSENQKEFENYIINTQTPVSATVKANTITNADFGLLKKGAIIINGYDEESEFVFLSDNNASSFRSAYLTGSDSKTVYDAFAYTNADGKAYIGYNTAFSGDGRYCLDKGNYYVYCTDSGEIKKLNVNYGCVTDFKTGKCLTEIIRGDIDFSNTVTLSDARQCLKMCARLGNFTEEEFLRADLNENGKVDIAEVRSVLKFVSKLQDSI